MTAESASTTFGLRKSPITLVQFTWTFVPFALLTTTALLYPELSQDLRLFRAIYLIRVSLLLTMPALVLLPFLHHGATAANLWRLFWTFGLIAHLAHLVYAVFVFGDQLETARLHPDLYGLTKENVSIYALIVEQQTASVVWGNIAVTVIWILDVFLAWFGNENHPKTSGFHWFAWFSVIVAFLLSTVYFYKNPVSYDLGIALVTMTALALVLRVLWRRPVDLLSSAASASKP